MKNTIRAGLAACLLAGTARAAPPVPASAYVITPSSPNGSATFAYGQIPLWFDETDFSACTGGVVSATCLGTPKPPSQSKPLPVTGTFTGTLAPAAAGTGTDASANATTALTSLKTGTVAHAGQLYVQNQSAATVQLILNPGGSQTIILIDPGAGANRQGGDWSAAQNAPWFVGAFSINGAAGSQVGAVFN